MTTNYTDTFITVSPDSRADKGTVPAKPDSIAGLQLALLLEHPYGLTSDDLLFAVHARRNGIAPEERAAARDAFLSRSLACLRASPLVKHHGWGLHHDAAGRVAAYGVESEAYREMATRPDLVRRPGMRSSRG